MKYLKTAVLTVLITLGCKPGPPPEHSTAPCPESEKTPVAQQVEQLKKEGFEIFEMTDEKTGDTLIMQQYFMAFLRSGPNRGQSQTIADSLQKLHMAHLSRMYEEGHADISGPFGDDGNLRGITVYNVPTLAMADSLAHLDPMVRSGRLTVEIKPWWAGKGYGTR